jgi:hypothetical protein
MCKAHPDLFDDIPWSTETVLSNTLERAKRLGVKTDQLPWWNDLDTFEDLVVYYNQYKSLRPEGQWAGEQTFLFLSHINRIDRSNIF